MFVSVVGLVGGLPTAVNPTALEEEREFAVAEFLAHRRPGFGRGQISCGTSLSVWNACW